MYSNQNPKRGFFNAKEKRAQGVLGKEDTAKKGAGMPPGKKLSLGNADSDVPFIKAAPSRTPSTKDALKSLANDHSAKKDFKGMSKKKFM